MGNNIDTDAIIPARYLVTTDPKVLARNCMDGLEEGWIERVSPGDILVAGENFGCGSSREHAPLAILGAGIPLVIARSFARIFYRNACNMGLVLLELGDEANKLHDGDSITVDTETGQITNLTTGQKLSSPPIPGFMREMLDQGGLIDYVKNKIKCRQ